MTRRSGCGGDDGGKGSYDGGLRPEDAEAEAAATTTAIARLRGQLKRPGSLDHPSVRRELRKLADELAELEDGKRRPGRHRSNVTRLPVPPIGHANGQADDATEADRRPDPVAVGSTAEF